MGNGHTYEELKEMAATAFSVESTNELDRKIKEDHTYIGIPETDGSWIYMGCGGYRRDDFQEVE